MKETKKILFATHGSRGDVQPMTVLASYMKKHHPECDITLLALGDHKDFVKRFGIKFIGLTTTAKELFEEKKEVLSGGEDIKSLVDVSEENKNLVLERAWRDFRELHEAVKGMDMVIYHPALEMQTLSLVEKYPEIIPVSYMLVPWRKTKNFPPAVHTLEQMPKEGEYYQSWEAIFNFLYPMGKDLINAMRKELGLGNLNLTDKEDDYLGSVDVLHQKTSVITMWNPVLLPIPDDWNMPLYPADYISMPSSIDPNWCPPEELEKFLANGDPPVYIGFGSMIHENPEKLLKIILESVKETGFRAVICEGWFTLQKPENFSPSDYGLSDNQIIFVKDIPHSWLLPKCSCSVIHGGAGTTVAALEAQKPIIVIPFLVDQPFWKTRVMMNGVSPKDSIHAGNISSEELSKSLKEATTNESIKQKAIELGKRRKEENGVKLSSQAISDIFAKHN